MIKFKKTTEKHCFTNTPAAADNDRGIRQEKQDRNLQNWNMYNTKGKEKANKLKVVELE